MSGTLFDRFVDEALKCVGAPYIWGGKGIFIFTLKGLVAHKFMHGDDLDVPIPVYDCSGLVTHALYMASNGKMDFRGTHSAATIWNSFPELDSDNGPGSLLLYPGHVAVGLGRDIVVDANRGDQTTVSLLHAREQGASVQVHRTIRGAHTLKGYRRIPLDKSELRA